MAQARMNDEDEIGVRGRTARVRVIYFDGAILIGQKPGQSYWPEGGLSVSAPLVTVVMSTFGIMCGTTLVPWGKISSVQYK
jgi:hypothetical protein